MGDNAYGNNEIVKKFPVYAEDHSVLKPDETNGGFVVTGGYTEFVSRSVNGVEEPNRLEIQGIGSTIQWQDGVIDPEKGANGVTVEAMVSAVIQRLEAFQKTRFACRENALAITKLEEAAHWMQSRREERFDRGVLNSHVV